MKYSASLADSVISCLFISVRSEHILHSLIFLRKQQESNFTVILWTANPQSDEKTVTTGELSIEREPQFYVS